jgi:hypothetical protein
MCVQTPNSETKQTRSYFNIFGEYFLHHACFILTDTFYLLTHSHIA